MECNIKNYKKHSFDDTMKTYIESTNYNKEICEINSIYFELRNRLSPEEQENLDALFNALFEKGIATAKEAYNRGLILGMSQHNNDLNDIKIKC